MRFSARLPLALCGGFAALLAVVALLLLSAAPARASWSCTYEVTGSANWNGTYYNQSGEKVPYSGSESIAPPPVIDPPQGGISLGEFDAWLEDDCEMNLNFTAEVKVTLTWVGATPAPKNTILGYMAGSHWTGGGQDFVATGNASNGLGDPYVAEVLGFIPYMSFHGYCTTAPVGAATHYEVATPEDGKIVRVKTLSASVSASGGSRYTSFAELHANADFLVTVTPVTMNLGGVTRDDAGNDNVLIGQEVIASLSAPGFILSD